MSHSRGLRRSRTSTYGLFGLALATATAVSACSSGSNDAATTPPTVASASEAGGSGWCGTISMYAQEYTPNAKVANTLNLKGFKQAADAYTKLYPCRTISFVDEKFTDNITTIRAKAAAGNLFDVFWAQWTSFNGQLPDGVAFNLAPSFSEQNPYAPKYASWAEAMNPQIINETKGGDGSSYNVNGDWVATGWYYNKDMFAKAGITELPKTFSEFTAACEKLKAAGMNPVSYVPYYGWLARPFLSNIYSADYQSLADLDGAPGYSTSDEAIATAKGILSPSDKRFMSWWPAFKKATDTWSPDYVTAVPDKNFQAEQDFQAGKAAMYFNGSYFGPTLKKAGVNFDWGVFPFPTVDKGTSPDATNAEVGDTVGGAGGAFQYAISTGQSNKSMKEAGKSEAVLDWVKFFSTPEWNEKIVNETGEFLPTFAGTKPLVSFASVAGAITQKSVTIKVGYTAPNLDTDDQRIFGAYLGGQLSLDEAKSQLQDAMDKAARAYIAKNKLQGKVGN